MLDDLRDRIATYLLEHRVCVISTGGSVGAWAMPVRYRLPKGSRSGRTLEVECLLPRWADAIYHLEENPQVLLIIVDADADGLRWLQYRGTARPIASPDWNRLVPERTAGPRPEERYVAVHVTPERIDVLDESAGWGARETLE
ncbi:MAG: hypothetical protein HY675_29200 [Chloroflexi bacterium]|nr:hypothetical protein [Chloroflexota bacterium]